MRSISAGISPCSRLGSIIAASFPSLPTGKINKNEAYLHCSLYLHDDAIRFAVLIITKLQFFWHKVIVIYFTIVPPIKPCQNQAAYFVKGALKKEAILEWFNCKDFKCERTLCSSSSFDCADALLPTERFKSLFTSSSGLYSGA